MMFERLGTDLTPRGWRWTRVGLGLAYLVRMVTWAWETRALDAVPSAASVLLLQAPGAADVPAPHAWPVVPLGLLLGVGPAPQTLRLGWMLAGSVAALAVIAGRWIRPALLLLWVVYGSVCARYPPLVTGVDAWAAWGTLLALGLPLKGAAGATSSRAEAALHQCWPWWVGLGAAGGGVVLLLPVARAAADAGISSDGVWTCVFALALVVGGLGWCGLADRGLTRRRGSWILLAAIAGAGVATRDLAWMTFASAVVVGGLDLRPPARDAAPVTGRALSLGLAALGLTAAITWHAGLRRWAAPTPSAGVDSRAWRGIVTTPISAAHAWTLGGWSASMLEQQRSRTRSCATAVARGRDGTIVELFSGAVVAPERLVDGALRCSALDEGRALRRLRRHPWAQRALLTDLARRAWSREMTVRHGVLGAVELCSWPPLAEAALEEEMSPRWCLQVSRPPDGGVVGSFR